jgi:hypothetical protein
MRATRRARSSLPDLVRADSFTVALQPASSVIDDIADSSDGSVSCVKTNNPIVAANSGVKRTKPTGDVPGRAPAADTISRDLDVPVVRIGCTP